MEAWQKDKIKELRITGLGYKKIAQELQVNVNSIKSYCRTHGLMRVDLYGPTCKKCGQVFVQVGKGKPRKFCTSTCRVIWWQEHKKQICRKTQLPHICTCCGCEFRAYHHEKRKYCSHICYIQDRFGGMR